METRRKFLIGYTMQGRDGRTGSGRGFAWVDTQSGLPTEDDIRDWERLMREKEGFTNVAVFSFQEVGQ